MEIVFAEEGTRACDVFARKELREQSGPPSVLSMYLLDDAKRKHKMTNC